MATQFECPRCHGADKHCLLCNGRGSVDDCAFSPHFAYSELVHSSHKDIPNDPPPEAIENLRRLAIDLLEPVRAVVGPLRVTSAYRSRSLDAAVAGPEWESIKLSAHAIGAAADVVPQAAGKTLLDVIEAVRSIPNLQWDQTIIEGGCVHLGIYAPRGRVKQRRQINVRVRVHDEWHYEVFVGTPEQMSRVA